MTELPSPNTRRWVARRKAAVVAAVSGGTISLAEACRRYRMSEEELSAWLCAFENDGILGLRVGSLQQRRGAGRSRPDDPALLGKQPDMPDRWTLRPTSRPSRR